MRTPQIVVSLLLLTFLATPGRTQDTSKTDIPLTSPADWPREVQRNGSTITFYQPQLDDWSGNQLTGRVATAVQTTGSRTPTYGVLWFSARTEVDKPAGTVTLNDLHVTRSSFPAAIAGEPDYLQLARDAFSTATRVVPLEQIEASLAVGRAERRQAQQPLRNDPPRILFSTTPAILVLIDGQPVLRNVEGTRLTRVINTRSLLLLDQESGQYFLRLTDRWLTAKALEGPWTLAQSPPAVLETALQAYDETADDLDDPNPEVAAWLAAGTIPRIYVSTTPAELLRTQGKPDLQPITDTHLLWVRNTTASLFMNTADQRYYTLISGRWFRTRSLENGPWEFVTGNELPQDFARIPETHPAGDVLPSVPGTPQAEQAVIANSIPQTATVRRDAAHLTVEYDGPPQFRDIEGTALRYAVNSATPVIQVAEDSYYASESGVWFTATSPEGPWSVATRVPPEIYSIPVSSPLHFVTNSYIYGSTPEDVYTGYTPGYLGTYIGPYDTVVYGSGYRYSPWIGTSWYGSPPTYGLGAAFDWNPSFGWGLGFGWGAGPVWNPWWGPWRTSFHRHRGRDRWWRDHGHWRWRDVNLDHHNLFDRWDQHAVLRPDRSGPNLRSRPSGVMVPRRPNDVFGGPNGQVFRRTPNGWEIRDGTRWRPEGRGSSPTRIPDTTRDWLNRNQAARDRSNSGTRMPPSLPGPTSPSGVIPNRPSRGINPPITPRVPSGPIQSPSGGRFGSPGVVLPGSSGPRFMPSGRDFGGFGRRSGLSTGQFGGPSGGSFGGPSGGRSGGFGGFGGRGGGFGGGRGGSFGGGGRR